MRRATKIARKVVVASIGLPLLLLGIVLIPVPGPGLLVSLIALVVLSLEFEWADKPLSKAKEALKKVIESSKVGN